jgi:hypothetical protein
MGTRPTEYFTDLEVKASRIHDWNPLVFPGLLQTVNYARLIINCGKPRARPDSIESLRLIRNVRQERYGREQ